MARPAAPGGEAEEAFAAPEASAAPAPEAPRPVQPVERVGLAALMSETREATNARRCAREPQLGRPSKSPTATSDVGVEHGQPIKGRREHHAIKRAARRVNLLCGR